jgi:hypothetical protein
MEKIHFSPKTYLEVEIVFLTGPRLLSITTLIVMRGEDDLKQKE